MKIATITLIPIPFAIGGAEKLWWGIKMRPMNYIIGYGI